MHRVIKLNQKACLKPVININTKLRKKKSIREKFSQADEFCSFWKYHGKCQKTQRYQTCNNESKKKLFSGRTKLSYNKAFFRKSINQENKKKILHK